MSSSLFLKFIFSTNHSKVQYEALEWLQCSLLVLDESKIQETEFQENLFRTIKFIKLRN